jgi:hypothetical protein
MKRIFLNEITNTPIIKMVKLVLEYLFYSMSRVFCLYLNIKSCDVNIIRHFSTPPYRYSLKIILCIILRELLYILFLCTIVKILLFSFCFVKNFCRVFLIKKVKNCIFNNIQADILPDRKHSLLSDLKFSKNSGMIVYPCRNVEHSVKISIFLMKRINISF